MQYKGTVLQRRRLRRAARRELAQWGVIAAHAPVPRGPFLSVWLVTSTDAERDLMIASHDPNSLVHQVLVAADFDPSVVAGATAQ